MIRIANILFLGSLLLNLVSGVQAADPTQRLSNQADADLQPVTFQQNLVFHSDKDTKQSIRYALFTPAFVDTKATYPLVLFLHGAGNRSTNTVAATLREAAQVWARATNQLKQPVFVVVPVVPPGRRWADNSEKPDDWKATPYTMSKEPTAELRMAVELVLSLEKTLPVDSHRLYLIGESMGGYGAWEAAIRHPNLWAAVIPIMGGTDPQMAGRIKAVPVWTFHAADDLIVPAIGTQEMVKALRLAGGNPRYTEFATGGHGIAGLACRTPGLLEWTYDQKK